MNQERVSTSTNFSKSLGGYRARYKAFLEERKLPKPSGKVTRFGQGLISFAIFFALFVAILTVFGLGLSWLNRAGSPQPGEVTQSSQPSVTGASAGMLPSPPAQPAGHAEVKSQSATKKKTDGK
jgi:hypothetical protein